MSDEKKSDPLDNFIAGIVLFVIIAALILYFYIDAWYHVRAFSFKMLSILPESLRDILFFYNRDVAGIIPLMHEDLQFHKDDFAIYYKEDETGISKKLQIDTAALWVFAPYTLALLALTFFLEMRVKRGKIAKPGGRNAMYNYARTQMEIWPFIKVVAPIMEKIAKNDDLDAGPNAAPAIPLEWMRKRDLLNKVQSKTRRELLTVRQRSRFTLDRPKAYVALVDNLGRPWVGVDDLSFSEKCLFSVLVPHIFGRVKESRLNNRVILNYFGKVVSLGGDTKLQNEKKALEAHIQKQIEKYRDSFATPYFNIDEFDDPYDPIISSFQALDSEKEMFEKGDKLIRDTLLTHRYVKTVFFSLMEKTWTYGVLSSSELLWVKGIDRDLFYVVSQQGRNSAFIEVAGCWSHYLTESSLGFKMLSPQVFNAIRAMDFDLYETHDNYIPHEDYDDSARWDKLVPDNMQAGAGLPKSQTSNASSRVF